MLGGKPLKEFVGVPEEHHKPQRSHLDADFGLGIVHNKNSHGGADGTRSLCRHLGSFM